MSINYNKIIQNLKEYLTDSFNDVKLIKNFNVDVVGFEKGYKKTEEERKNEKKSIDYIQNIEILDVELTFLHEKTIIYKYKDEYYIGYSRKDNVNLNIKDLKPFCIYEEELDLGIFLSFFRKKESYLLINNRIKKDEVINILELEDDSVYNFNEILKLFDQLKIYKIGKEFYDYFYCQEKESIELFKYKILGLIRCKEKKENINIENFFNLETIQIYEDIFRDNSINNFPYENLYLSISQNHPKFCFLEVYRILEKLYPIIYCYKLRKELNILDKDILSINSLFVENLKLKPRERDSIKSIFEYASSKNSMNNIIENIKNEFEISNDSGSNAIAISKWIYKIRNNAVHLSFDNSKDLNIEDILKEDNLIKHMVLILKDLYIDLFA